MTRPNTDILAGLFFVTIGLVAGWISLSLPLGNLRRMDSGFFPAMLSLLLLALGAAIGIRGLLTRNGELPAQIGWRGLACIIPAVVLFGLLMRPLGFVPTVFLTLLITTFASPRYTLLPRLAICLGLTLACYLIFIRGLELTIPIWGTALKALWG